MVMRRKIGDIYKAMVDSYNNYHQHMRLLGEVDKALFLMNGKRNIVNGCEE